MKKFLCVFTFIIFIFNCAGFAADNMRMFPKENGEVITGFKIASIPEEIKITIAYPDNYAQRVADRFPIVLLFDREEYNIETLNKMFYSPKSKNPQALIVSFRLRNINFSQEQFDSFVEEIFAFIELNYRGESDPSKRIILAKDALALIALNSMQKEANYFFNLGMILNATTALPAFDQGMKNQSNIFVFSQRENIVNLQNLFLSADLKPLQNFSLKIDKDTSFEQFDLRYFIQTPKIKQVKPLLPKEISQEAPITLQVKTSYSTLDFLPTNIKFAPPVLDYNQDLGSLKVLLDEPTKVKISGIFEGTKWSKNVKISK